VLTPSGGGPSHPFGLAGARRGGNRSRSRDRARCSGGARRGVFANAGIQAFKPLLEMEDGDRSDEIDTDLTGIANTLRAFVPHLVERGGGRVIVTHPPRVSTASWRVSDRKAANGRNVLAKISSDASARSAAAGAATRPRGRRAARCAGVSVDVTRTATKDKAEGEYPGVASVSLVREAVGNRCAAAGRCQHAELRSTALSCGERHRGRTGRQGRRGRPEYGVLSLPSATCSARGPGR
jgi:hypothetical protein